MRDRLGLQEVVGDLSISFVAIMVEAMPFMLIGSLIGGLIEAFVHKNMLGRLLEGRERSAIFIAAGLGLIFPVCDCAIAPLVKRLLSKGVPLSVAIAFLLAGPIVNPIVAASTWLAYQGNWSFLVTRMVLGYAVAIVVAILMDFLSVLPFNLMESTCDIRLVHGVTTEILAQAIHNNYLEGLRAAQADLGDKPAAIPWDELPEFLKEFNRGQADHIGLKLDAVGCGLAPSRDWDAELFHFTAEEVEKLSRMEHQRWWNERIADCWTLGPRDDKRKTHPCMVPWEQLSKEEQDKDRQAVVDLPELLSSIDLQIYRVAVGNSA